MIHIFPRWKEVWAWFTTAQSASLSIPSNYTRYEVLYAGVVNVTTHEVDHILTWTNAKSLRIEDTSNVVAKLLTRIDELKTFRRLEKLELTVQQDSYRMINVGVFLEQLGSLKTAHFRAVSLSVDEFAEFIRSQKIPHGWVADVYDRWVMFEKSYWRRAVLCKNSTLLEEDNFSESQ